MKARLHLHGHNGPQTRGYIVGEPAALRALAKSLLNAADNLVGFNSTTFYGSDGHEYELLIVSDVSEDEWQTMPLPSAKNSDPRNLTLIRTYDELQSN